MTRFARTLIASAVVGALLAPAAQASHPVPPMDISKLEYKPIGFFKPGEPIPSDYGKGCAALAPQRDGKLFNPSGRWNAFDNTVFENLCLPFRNEGDTSANDPDGNGGEARYGYCAGGNPADPLPNSFEDSGGAGTCPNHQLEYIDYYKATMLEILKDFNPTFHEYDFSTSEGTGRLPAISIPGADHPDQNIIIGSHYDQTSTAPTSFWDSQEGHAEMIRIAKIMADDWKATGTRPSATVKFVPMDGEEDGSLGSKYYVQKVIPDPDKVRSYWNADPCAGGYPARRYGNPADVLPIDVQIGTETGKPRVAAFNGTVRNTIEQVLDAVDDTINSYPDKPQTFISTNEDPVRSDMDKYIFVSTDKPLLFSSDWTNFIGAGIPIFNPTPKVTGPSSPSASTPPLYAAQNNYPDGLIGFHSPVDNLQTMSRFTGQDPTGNSYPEAYMKGMEFCSDLLAWGMLQPNAGGAQTTSTAPVAYYEVLPTTGKSGSLMTFDAGGSYQYADPATHALVDPAKLQLRWDFGDGSQPAYGRVVKHAYQAAGSYDSTLTVTNRETGASKTMSVPVDVGAGSGKDTDPPGQGVDDPSRGS